MPYRLVHKLQKLMTMEFHSKKSTNLGSFDSGVPDEVMDEIDQIAETARQVFGPRIQPTPQQEYIMKQAGFTVEPGAVDMVGWKTGKIVTPKGMIYYP